MTGKINVIKENILFELKVYLVGGGGGNEIDIFYNRSMYCINEII